MLNAIIDLGTNTFNLLIADIRSVSSFRVVHSSKAVVKIGAGGMTSDLLRPDAMKRAKQALSEQLNIISEHGCDRVFAFATSAIRSSSNGTQFVKEVKESLGLEIKVISGDQEAQLIYEGVNLAVSFTDEPVLIMDIGGGSTEFIIADTNRLHWKKSYRLGISRILQALEPNDPLLPADMENLNGQLSAKLGELLCECRLRNVRRLIGSSGSFDSFAEMIWAEKGNDKTTEDILSEEIDLVELRKLHGRLIAMDHAERRKVKGLVEMRVDTIHLASSMVQWVLRECDLKELLLSTYALKEGVLNRIMLNRL